MQANGSAAIRLQHSEHPGRNVGMYIRDTWNYCIFLKDHEMFKRLDIHRDGVICSVSWLGRCGGPASAGDRNLHGMECASGGPQERSSSQYSLNLKTL